MQTTMPRVQVMKNRDARRKKVQWCDDVQIGEASTLVSGMLSINEKKRLWLQVRSLQEIILFASHLYSILVIFPSNK